MRKNVTAFAAFFIALIIISCAGLPETHPGDSGPDSAEKIDVKPSDPETAESKPERPDLPDAIMGTGVVPKETLASFLLEHYMDFEKTEEFTDYVETLSGYYIEEAAIEGINHDIAFAQMCLETGFLRFGNLVSIDMNNFAGLGATGLPDQDGVIERGLSFSSPRIGVRAHIQHLKGYATTEPLKQELVNPRYRFLVMLDRLGTSPTIQGLTGSWATDPQYDKKITAILERLYEFYFD